MDDEKNDREPDFERLLESVKQAGEIRRGEREPSRVTRVTRDEDGEVRREVLDSRYASWKPLRDRPEGRMTEREISGLEKFAEEPPSSTGDGDA